MDLLTSYMFSILTSASVPTVYLIGVILRDSSTESVKAGLNAK